ncbi:MAG: hypothetical protein J5861_02015 [Desulfovibrio sp.]|nr:hypothetical protein [Desulfovibrio sp.]
MDSAVEEFIVSQYEAAQRPRQRMKAPDKQPPQTKSAEMEVDVLLATLTQGDGRGTPFPDASGV